VSRPHLRFKPPNGVINKQPKIYEKTPTSPYELIHAKKHPPPLPPPHTIIPSNYKLKNKPRHIS